MKNKKSLVAIDLDGTLLSSDYHLSLEAKRYLKRLEDRGTTIVLASGRPPRNILSYYREIGLSSPIIAYNGLYLANPSDPSFGSVEQRIPSSLVAKIIENCSVFLKNYLVESSDSSLYLLKDEPKLDPYFPYSSKNRKSSLDEVLRQDPFIAVFEGDSKGEETIEGIVKDYSPCSFRHWRNMPYSELYVEGMDKGNALAILCQKFHIERENVFAFGDGDNDASMLSFAMHGFAIKSSKSDQLKSRFPLTEEGNDNDGVIKTLKAFFGD